MAGFLTESPDTRNKRKIDRALAKDLAAPKSNTSTAPVSPTRSSSQSKKTDPKVVKSKNNSFSHGFN